MYGMQHEFFSMRPLRDPKMGKKSLVERYIRGVFEPSGEHLIHDCCSAVIQFFDKTISLSIWQIHGDYDRLREVVYKDKDVIVICFSKNSRDSFDNVKSDWQREVRRNLADVPIVLCGTKLDSGTGRDYISYYEGLRKKEEIGAVDYVETSALTGENVDSLFESCLLAVLDSYYQKGTRKMKRECFVQ